MEFAIIFLKTCIMIIILVNINFIHKYVPQE